jgi:putative FmdB family regulatory protein
MKYPSGLKSQTTMPLYEYECEACGTRFEQIRKFSDPPIEQCPACRGIVHKLISLPAFQFKGTGWYVTDYARKGQGAESNNKSAENDGKSSDASEPGPRDKSSPSVISTSSSPPATVSTGSSSSES